MKKLLAPNEIKNLIEARVRALRKNMSQETLMAQLQLQSLDGERGILKRIENGIRFVPDIELKLIAEYFNISYKYLLDGKDESKK